MSVVNVRFQPDRIDILTDTMQYINGTPASLCATKARIGNDGGFAWAGRGLVRLSDRFDGLAGKAGLCSSFDDAELAAYAWADSITDADHPNGNGQEITLAGWSARSNALVVRQWTKVHGKPLQVDTFEPGVYLSPAPKDLPPLPATVTDAQFLRLALAQWKVRSEFLSKMCIGGVMHLTTITPEGASRRIVGLYPDYAEHAAELGCPISNEVAAFLGAEAVAA